jgi:anti-sigma factor RsiW
MNCADFENLLADYIDGSLANTQRLAIEEHAATCAACREFMGGVTGALAFLKRADQVLPPPELVTRIAYQAPIGRTREPFETPGIWSKVSAAWLQPFLRPRFAMGMAMTILSFAMLQRCTGVQVQHIQPAENIRLVYEIQTRLKELQEQQEMVRNRQGQETSPSRSTKRDDGRKTPNQTDNRQGDKKP